MTEKFYTYVGEHRNEIVEYFYVPGDPERKCAKHDFVPLLALEANDGDGKYTGLKGEKLKVLELKGLKQYKQFMDSNTRNNAHGKEDIIPMHGNIKPEYQFINRNYKDMKYDTSKIRTFFIDIEVISGGPFPKPEESKYAISSISIKDSRDGSYYVMATKDYDPSKIMVDVDPKTITFLKCEDELHIYEWLAKIFEEKKPDIVCGYYSDNFDMPYIIFRGEKVAPKELKMLSPLRQVSCGKRVVLGKTEFYPRIKGITCLDYMKMYKKYIFTPRQSYKLDFIATEELGEQKIDYSEYDNLHQLWEKNPQKFLDYNVYDVELIDLLDKKLGLLALHCTIAYQTQGNFIDIMGTVQVWDTICYNELLKENVLCPPKIHHHSSPYAGAYVKTPKPGKYKWVASVDLNSLYPHIQQQWNISPETLLEHIPPEKVSIEEIDRKILDQEITPKSVGIMAGNGYYFNKQHEGFIPKLLKKKYTERAKAKKKMLQVKQEQVLIEEELKKRGYTLEGMDWIEPK